MATRGRKRQTPAGGVALCALGARRVQSAECRVQSADADADADVDADADADADAACKMRRPSRTLSAPCATPSYKRDEIAASPWSPDQADGDGSGRRVGALGPRLGAGLAAHGPAPGLRPR